MLKASIDRVQLNNLIIKTSSKQPSYNFALLSTLAQNSSSLKKGRT